MADFFHPFISWFIAIVTLVGIFALLYMTWRLSRHKTRKGEKVKTMGHVWDENLEELNNPLPRWWLYMFYITSIWGLGYLIFYPGLGAYEGILGWSQENQYDEEVQQAEERYSPIYAKFANQDIESLVTNEEALTIGGRLFSTYCTTCHGSDARGARGYPNLRDADWLYGDTPEAIKSSIMNGRIGVMPPWGEILGYEKSFSVAAYVKQLSGREVDQQVAFEGKKIYMTNCAVCHGNEGEGKPQLGAPKLTDDIWLYGGSDKKILESIMAGRNGNMPGHKEFLGEDKVHLLATYVYSFAKNPTQQNN